MTATGRGHLLAADADREHAVGVLKTAFVQGRLTQDEFELRVGHAFTSRTYAHLAAVTADLPSWRMSAQPLGGPARAKAQLQAGNDFKTATRLLIAAITLAIVLWLGTCFPVDAAAFSG
jgi:Domain of unknown function (DUF1707)